MLFAREKERTTLGRKKRGGPEGMLDKTVGGLSEAAGRVTGDKSLEAEGARRASSVHRTKPEAVAAAKERRVNAACCRVSASPKIASS
jgi:uncharacterized protein YjbJ (UPF0337 family)